MRVAIARARTSCPMAAEQTAPPCSSHWNVVQADASSPDAMTSSCMPESSLLELGAALAAVPS